MATWTNPQRVTNPSSPGSTRFFREHSPTKPDAWTVKLWVLGGGWGYDGVRLPCPCVLRYHMLTVVFRTYGSACLSFLWTSSASTWKCGFIMKSQLGEQKRCPPSRVVGTEWGGQCALKCWVILLHEQILGLNIKVLNYIVNHLIRRGQRSSQRGQG